MYLNILISVQYRAHRVNFAVKISRELPCHLTERKSNTCSASMLIKHIFLLNHLKDFESSCCCFFQIYKIRLSKKWLFIFSSVGSAITQSLSLEYAFVILGAMSSDLKSVFYKFTSQTVPAFGKIEKSKLKILFKLCRHTLQLIQRRGY